MAQSQQNKHDHNHSRGHQHGRGAAKNVLMICICLAFLFAAIEALGGWYANSLALLSDAGHMAADALALILAAVAAWISEKPPSAKHTFGLGRAEVIGAWVSSLFILAIAAAIIIEAISRLHEPEHVHGGTVMLIGAIGIIVNMIIAWILSQGEKTLNTRAAIIHVLGDLLGSAAALIAGGVIYFSGWTPIDPILSMFIAILIIISSFRILRESLLVLMEGVPHHINVEEVGKQMCTLAHVESVHDLHIWTLATGVVVLSAHVDIRKLSEWDSTLLALRKLLKAKYDIEHITLQPEINYQVIKYVPEGMNK